MRLQALVLKLTLYRPASVVVSTCPRSTSTAEKLCEYCTPGLCILLVQGRQLILLNLLSNNVKVIHRLEGV